MNGDTFRETLFRQYKEEVQEMLIESTHKLEGVNWNEFNYKLARTWDAAKIDGMSPQDFELALTEVCPDHIAHIDYSYFGFYKQVA